MTTVLQIIVLLLTAVTATLTVLTREPVRQAMMASVYGLVLGLLFVLFAAPDLGLAQTAVGAVALPLMILLAVAKVKDSSR